MTPIRTFRHEDLAFEIYDDVYEPAEDSCMLLEAALDTGPARALEIGTGCGLTAINLSRECCPFVVGTDISPAAIRCARSNASRFAPDVHLILSDILSAIRGCFDLIAFNPPYLPVEGGGVEHISWSGGAGGRDLIDRFIREVPPHLSNGGCALLIQSSLNDLDRSRSIAAEMDLRLEVLNRKSFFFETLYLVKISR